MRSNPKRYGLVESIDGNTVTMDSGVHITLNWNDLSLTQSGRDTRLIQALYKVHNLRWWGNKGVNLVFGALGLLLLSSLTIAGLFLSRKREN